MKEIAGVTVIVKDPEASKLITIAEVQGITTAALLRPYLPGIVSTLVVAKDPPAGYVGAGVRVERVGLHLVIKTTASETQILDTVMDALGALQIFAFLPPGSVTYYEKGTAKAAELFSDLKTAATLAAVGWSGYQLASLALPLVLFLLASQRRK